MKYIRTIYLALLIPLLVCSLQTNLLNREEELTNAISVAQEDPPPASLPDEGKKGENEHGSDEENKDEVQDDDDTEDHSGNRLEDKDGDLDKEKQQPTSPVPAQPSLPVAHISCHKILEAEDQCQFAYDHCQNYKIGFVNYVSLYYCQESRWFSLISYIVILIILFTSLGITASEFLCPNLDTLAKLFKMSESLAGVTLLALGNGSPDVFSTLEAMKIDSPSLAIGELIGAAMFITCVVVGCMAIIKPFKVNKRPFMRDTAFLLISIVVTIVFLSDQSLDIVEAFVMMALYVLYVIFVVFWDWFATRRRNAILLEQKMRSQSFVDVNSKYNLSRYSSNNVPELDHETSDIPMGLDLEQDLGTMEDLNNQLEEETMDSFAEWKKQSVLIRPSLLSALDLNHKFSHSPNNEALADQISLTSLPAKRPRSQVVSPRGSVIKMYSTSLFSDGNDEVPHSEYLDPLADVNKKLLKNIPPEILVNDKNDITSQSQSNQATSSSSNEPVYEDEEYQNQYISPDGPVLQRSRRNSIQTHHSFEEDLQDSSNFNQFLWNVLHTKILDDSSGLYLFFPSLQEFTDKSLVDKIVTIICLPTNTVLQLTVPVVNTDGETRTIDNDLLFHRGYFFLLTRCFIAPFAATFLIAYKNESSFPLLNAVMPLAVSFALCYFIRYTASIYKTNGQTRLVKLLHFLVSLIGFIIAITWISTIATELISIIKFFSILFNLSDAILGVTIFAVGNSLADLISNFTIARMGFPMMALSACFGGPLLNILLGIGCSSLYIIPLKDSDIKINFSATLIVSVVTVLINLVFLLIVVPLNGWWMNRMVGVTMIGFWSVATVICVIIEIFSE